MRPFPFKPRRPPPCRMRILPTSMASISFTACMAPASRSFILHGGVNPDSFGSNLAELAKGRQVIAVHLQAHGRTPDTDRPLRCETLGDDVAALIGHLNLGNTMWYKGSQARQTLRLAGGGPFFPPYPHTPGFLDGIGDRSQQKCPGRWTKARPIRMRSLA